MIVYVVEEEYENYWSCYNTEIVGIYERGRQNGFIIKGSYDNICNYRGFSTFCYVGERYFLEERKGIQYYIPHVPMLVGYNWGNHYSYIALIGTLDWQCMHWLTVRT